MKIHRTEDGRVYHGDADITARQRLRVVERADLDRHQAREHSRKVAMWCFVLMLVFVGIAYVFKH